MPAAKHVAWTDAERTALRQMRENGLGPAEIARLLGRSKYACARQVRTLKLPAQRPQPDMVPPPELRTPRPQPLPRGAHTLPPLASEMRGVSSTSPRGSVG
jgi:hypothetical protein